MPRHRLGGLAVPLGERADLEDERIGHAVRCDKAQHAASGRGVGSAPLSAERIAQSGGRVLGALTSLVLVALVAVLPFLFRLFAAGIAPYAPRSEFAFLLMVAVLAAYATRQLGMYYLVGAFVVGVTAQRFRERLPAFASEQMLHAVEFFASFFVPFYFFGAGLELRSGDFRADALLLGLVFLGAALPVRIGAVALHRRLALGEPLAQGARVALPMVPTLVFTLVLAGILRDRYQVSPMVFGGLIVYTLLNTVLPGLQLHVPPPEFEEPHAPQIDVAVYESD